MTHIGIDYGSKRVGVAVSDENETMAFPLVVLKNTKRLLVQLKKIAREKNSNTFVIGESKNYKGAENKIMKEAKSLKRELEAEKFIVHLEPEFMTSAEAVHIQGSGKMTDASAAAIILQSFLEKKKNQN